MAQSNAVPKTTWPARLVSHVRTPLYRNGYALIFSAVSTSGLGIIYWALAARYYSAELVGLSVAAISAMNFLAGVARLNLDSALFRFVPTAGHATRRLVAYSYLVSETLSLLISAVFLLGISFWSPALAFLRESWWLAAWFMLMTMSTAIFTMQDSALTGLRQAMWIPIENVVYAVGKIGLLIVFAHAFPRYGIIASWTVPAVLLVLPMNVLIFGRLIPRHITASQHVAVPIVRSRIAKYVAGTFLGYLFFLATSALLPIIVLQQAGSSANAHFYLPWLVSSSLQLINQKMTVSLTVEGALDQGKLYVYARRVIIQALRMLGPIIVVLVLGAPIVLRIFGRSYVQEGTTLLRLLSLAALPHMFNSLFIGIARVQNRIATIAITQGCMCLLTLGLSYVLLDLYGITGVGVACLLSQTSIALVVIITQLRPMLRPTDRQPL